MACGSSPLDALSRVIGPDGDSDGLSDACEAIAGTNPAVIDTDGDGVLDGLEYLRIGTNPVAFDTDADGCRDSKELASMNNDLTVNVADLGITATRFSVIGDSLYFWDFDTNRDGAINAIDLLTVALQFGAC